MGPVTKVVLIIAFTVAIVAIVLVSIFAYFRSHSLTQQALSIASQSTTVTSVTGTDISAGKIVTGRIKNGKGRLSIPISGSSGVGTLIVLGESSGDRWILTNLTFTGDGDSEPKKIDVPN